MRSVSTILELGKINLGAYPSSAADADGGKGLVSSGDNVVEYFTMDNGGYCISVSSPRTENVFYFSTATNMIQEGGCPTVASMIAVGDQHVCANVSGKIYCWGNNENGQLGNNSESVSSTVPVAVDTSGVLAGKTVTAISAENYHTCVIASGSVYCWGDNQYGQLGNGTTTNSRVPVAVGSFS